MHVERYYTAKESLARRMAASGRAMAHRATSAAEHDEWAHDLRGRLAACIGLPNMIACAPRVEVLEEVPVEGLLRRKLLLETEPGVWMPFYQFLPPMAPGERRAFVICCHGHGSSGKLAVAGVEAAPELAETIRAHRYAYGLQLAKRGYVTLCPDARGFGERREASMQGDEPARFMDDSCGILARWGLPLGQSVVGMWVWDLMRLCDHALAHERCAPGRLGCVGLSGGGLQTLWLCALDERVQAAIVSGYYYGFREALLELPNCFCNYAPDVWRLIDVGELGALIAPRALAIETGDRDPLNGVSGLANVAPYVEIARSAYRLFGAEHRLLHDVFEGSHRWHGEASVHFLEEALPPR